MASGEAQSAWQAGPPSVHHRSRFLRSLPDADLRRIAQYLRQRTLEREEMLYCAGSIIRSVVFPHNAAVSLIGLTAEDASVESAVVGSEGYLGVEIMLGSAVATSTAVAQKGEASTIALDRLLTLAEQMPSLRAALLAYAWKYLAAVNRLAACNARHSLKQRACRRLLLALDQSGGKSLAITQEALGRALGAGRTSINLLCKELRNDGAIEYSRGHITILDSERMKGIACECYIHLKHVLFDDAHESGPNCVM
jgi:CRP-like cAMP-binding protein